MKATIFALFALAGYDLCLRHSQGLHALGACVAGFGHAIGAWVFSTG